MTTEEMAEEMAEEKTDDRPEETLDPQDWEAFRSLAHRMVDRMLDVQRTVRERPAWRPVPEGVEARFREDRPMEGGGAEVAYSDFLELVLPYPTGNDHPRFWGWAGGTGSPMGMMAEMLGAGMNSVPGLFNDAAARVERQVVDWMKAALGMPVEAGVGCPGRSQRTQTSKTSWSGRWRGKPSDPGRPS